MHRETARAKECQNLRNAKERKRMDMPAPWNYAKQAALIVMTVI